MYRFLIFFLLFSVLNGDDIKLITASGTSQDPEKAKQSALRNAVEKVISDFVDADTYNKNLSAIKNNIYSSVSGYVKSSQVLKVQDSPIGKLVTVRAEINATVLKKDLQQLNLLMIKLDMPRIMVLNLHKDKGEMSELGAKCYMGIVQAMTDNGLFLIDKTEQETFFKEQKKSAYSELNNQIADFGLKINADYIVRFDLKISSNQNSLYTDAEVISPSTGKIIYSSDEVASFSNSQNEVDRIIIAKNTGKALGNRLTEKIIDNWKFMLENGSYFTLVVEGYSGYTKILNFQKWLTDVKGIIAVSEIESGDQKSTLLIKFSGNRKELKEKIFKLFTEKGWITRLVRSENSRAFVKILNQ